MKNLSDQHNSHTLVGCLLTPPGEEPDEAPKLENANQRFAFSLISDRHGSYLVKKLSDRLNSRCSLVAYLSPVVCLKPTRRYPETDRPASEASGWPEGSPLGIAAAPASFFLKTGKLGYHRGASWIKSAFSKICEDQNHRLSRWF